MLPPSHHALRVVVFGGVTKAAEPPEIDQPRPSESKGQPVMDE